MVDCPRRRSRLRGDPCFTKRKKPELAPRLLIVCELGPGINPALPDLTCWSDYWLETSEMAKVAGCRLALP